MHKRCSLCRRQSMVQRESKYCFRGERKLGNECIHQNVGIGYESQRTNETHNGKLEQEGTQPHNNTTVYSKRSDTFDKDGNLQRLLRP